MVRTLARDGCRGGVVATGGTRGVITTRGRLVSGALLAVVFRGLSTNPQVTHFSLDFVVSRHVVGVGVIGGRRSGTREASSTHIRRNRLVSAR
jgi:hypothetical protein